MDDAEKTREQLLPELQAARQEIADLELVLSEVPDLIMKTDTEGKIEFINRALPGWGYERDELRGVNAVDFLIPEEREEAMQTIKRISTGESVYRETQRTRPDGQPGWMFTRSFPIIHNNQVVNVLHIISDITAQKQAEAERMRLQQEVIDAQRHAIQELSTPVIPIMDRIIVMPLIGSIDSLRAKDITRNLLSGINQHRAKVVILDVTGVGIVDTGVVNHLNKTIQAAQLKGARTIVTGISDAVAEAIVDLGIDWGGVQTLSDLRTGLTAALASLGLHIGANK
jgi:rsbT co-antagonist protein RsbR